MERPTPTAALAGAIAMAFALLVAYLASVAGIPFAPVALGQAIIEVLPGWISIPLIELLQHWAQRLLVIGVLAGFLLAGAAAGALLSRPRGAMFAIVLGGGPWAVALLLGQAFAGARFDLGASLFDASLGAAAFFAAMAFLSTAERVAEPSAGRARRRVLLAGMSAAAVLTVVSLGLSSTVRAFRPAAELMPFTPRRLRARAVVPAAEAPFEAIERITPRVTGLRDHYVVDTALIDPRIYESEWRLEIAGAVERPFSIGYDELLDMEAVERVHTLECISNEIGGDLISTAIWTGVPMRDLLERARPAADAYDVVLHSVEGYTDSIRIAKAMEPGTLVAYLMNGYTIPQEHGYPARVLVPNIYGMKNVKWIGRIEVVRHDYQGYWMERGWSDVATYNTHSRIDVPRGSTSWPGGPVQVAGVSFAGARGITRVEVSTDGGDTWADATLEVEVGDHAWRRWRYEWTPSEPGRHRLAARSYDGAGQVETSVRRAPFPAGATGYNVFEVTIVRA